MLKAAAAKVYQTGLALMLGAAVVLGSPAALARNAPEVSVTVPGFETISLADLRSPGTQLEALEDGLKGYIGIRINNQWRVIFRWVPPNASDVRITDYH